MNRFASFLVLLIMRTLGFVCPTRLLKTLERGEGSLCDVVITVWCEMQFLLTKYIYQASSV